MTPKRAANRWRPDCEACHCTACQRHFTLTRRRHHCRQCGDLFCADCSAFESVVRIVHPSKLQRVCEKCYDAASAVAPLSKLVPSTSPVSQRAVVPSGAFSASETYRADDQRGDSKEDPKPNSLGRFVEVPLPSYKSTSIPSQPDQRTSPRPEHAAPSSIPPYMYPLGESDEEDEDEARGGTGTPPSLHPIMDGPSPTHNAGALSFLSAMEELAARKQEELRECSLPVLLFVREGVQLPMVVSVTDGETVGDVLRRLSKNYFELLHGLRRRPNAQDLEQVAKELYCCNETGMVIATSHEACELARARERVVVTSASSAAAAAAVTRSSTRSVSVHSFFNRSERSDHEEVSP